LIVDGRSIDFLSCVGCSWADCPLGSYSRNQNEALSFAYTKERPISDERSRNVSSHSTRSLMSNPTPDLSSSLSPTTHVVPPPSLSFGTHLLTAQSSAAPSERCLHLRLAADNLLLVSSVGKVQQGSSLSRAATSSVPRSVAHYTQKHVSDFFWSLWANRRPIRHAPDLAGGTRGAVSVGESRLGGAQGTYRFKGLEWLLDRFVHVRSSG
jgi:hypothetical protein